MMMLPNMRRMAFQIGLRDRFYGRIPRIPRAGDPDGADFRKVGVEIATGWEAVSPCQREPIL